ARARPVGVTERAGKWARRRPAAALLIAALLVASVAAAGVGVWLRQLEIDRRVAKAHREGQAREAIDSALRRAGDLRAGERWREAQLVLTEASTHVADADSPELEEQLRQAQSDLRIAADLEHVRQSRPIKFAGSIDYQQRAARYPEAFDQTRL